MTVSFWCDTRLKIHLYSIISIIICLIEKVTLHDKRQSMRENNSRSVFKVKHPVNNMNTIVPILGKQERVDNLHALAKLVEIGYFHRRDLGYREK